MTKDDRHTLRTWPVSAVRYLKVHMRFRTVPRISASPHRLIRHNLLALANGRRSLLQMREHDERSLRRQGDDHPISSNRVDARTNSLRLSQHVRHQGHLRASGTMIGFLVMDLHHSARHRRQERHTETVKDARRFGREDTLPTPGGGSAERVDCDEVDRMGNTEQIGAMAGDLPRRTVLHPPLSAKWKLHHHFMQDRPDRKSLSVPSATLSTPRSPGA